MFTLKSPRSTRLENNELFREQSDKVSKIAAEADSGL